MKLKYYVLRRIAFFSFVFLLVSTITFLVSHVIPADPAVLWAGPHATKEMVERARKELGLDKPLHVQYALWLKKVVTGDFGVSILTRRPVLEDLMTYFPATFELTTVSMVITLAIGIPLGVLSAVKKDKIEDHVCRIISLSGVSMPVFWFGMSLQIVFAAWLGWLPVSGRTSPGVYVKRITGLYLLDTLITGNLAGFVDALSHIVLPALALSFACLGVIVRIVRGSMLDVMEADFIRTPRAMGISERQVMYKYALRNAMLPTITMTGLTYGSLLGGMVVIEAVFDWPGIGYYMANAILALDYPAIMGSTILITAVYLVVNLIVDIIYAIVDPRIKY